LYSHSASKLDSIKPYANDESQYSSIHGDNLFDKQTPSIKISNIDSHDIDEDKLIDNHDSEQGMKWEESNKDEHKYYKLSKKYEQDEEEKSLLSRLNEGNTCIVQSSSNQKSK